VDNVLVANAIMKQHVEDLRVVLGWLREVGLVLNTETCVYGVEEVDFIGHHASAEGIWPLQDKVDGL
jgi:hypothetical protein